MLYNRLQCNEKIVFISSCVYVLSLFSRRHVDNGTCPNYESSFSLGFSPLSNATFSTSCSSQWIGDACINTTDLSFPPGSCSLTVVMEVAQDRVFETWEQLLLYITNCTNCASNVTSLQPIQIIIDDADDCKYICSQLHLTVF